MTDLSKFLHLALQSNHFDLSSENENTLLTYLELLKKWSQVYNLTAISDLKDAVWLHIIDSLTVAPYLRGQRIIDVGTGAGLPGIPLALIYPDKHFVLLDSNSKKTHFLTHVVQTLQLKNIEVIHSRCEDFHPTNCFDTIVSRAFAVIEVMLAVTNHLACPDGQFLAMKGLYPEKELANIPDTFRVLDVHALKIHGFEAQRHLVCIKRK